ncbi:fungal-specific transcription factor domain-containing protein [Roridomyces roridus]|uniref:Fungal-specific transcription factor domain-containing protein n=1 Tax=Roridomyces roridus TaxID=1738132 RepID=A0AAD7BV16_9AGAR|nr:fungal-specific transcription factor domain-containing protein [Roridomyces roridus]
MDYYSDASEEESVPRDVQQNSRKRSSRACDSCRPKSKCERVGDDNCKGCVLAGTVCTFLGPSYKRGPPKGYIHAIESRWHQVESLLGALLQCPDSRVQSVVADLRTDDLAREILARVDGGPYGPSGRLDQPGGATKEDFFASILRSNGQSTGGNDNSRSRRQSRVSREKVSSSVQDRGLSVVPTREWQDNLSNRLASSSSSASGSRNNSFDLTGVPLNQRRRLNGAANDVPTPPDWKDMYTLDNSGPEPADPSDETAERMGALSLDENQEVRFHGHTSGLHLLGRNIRTDGRKEGGIWNLPMARVWPPIRDQTQLIQEEDMEIELPPVHVQEHLLQLYFAHIHPVFPVIHKTRFLTEYKSSPNPAQKFSSLLLLAMFSISARFSDQDTPLPPRGNMWEAGGKYLNLAKQVLAKVLHRSRPSTCQTLLLLGYREFGIGSMEQGWIYIGMAIRMAIDLGLNCNLVDWKAGEDNHALFNREDTQTRRQIWWACLVADRYGSMYMGRPVAIREEDFDTPLPEEEEEPSTRDSTTMGSFRASGNLGLILGAIISKIYPVRRTAIATRQAALVQLESRLDQWYLSLPEALRYDTATRRGSPSPPVILMHVRYWGTVLLLFRAFIPNWKGLDPPPQNSTLELKAFDLAQGAATHISALVQLFAQNYTLKRCSPFMTSYLLNAGSVTLRPSNPQASLGLQQCLAALKEMEIVWPSAARAWELLNGVKLGVLNAVAPVPALALDRHKRHAEDAFGNDRPDYPASHATALVEERQMGQPMDGVQDMANKLMAHMLGLDIPGVEPSTSLYTGCDWWERPSADLSQPLSIPQTWSPQAAPGGSGLYSPLSTMPPPSGWHPDSREAPRYHDGYQYDHFGT